MPDQLPLAFQTEFDARVLAAYQQSAILLDKVYSKKNVTGKFCQFRRRSKGAATAHVRNSPVTPLNLGLTVATAELTDWDAAERLDPFDLRKINWDDFSVVAENLGNAIGRRHDQLIVDAMESGVTTTVAVDYGTVGTDTALTVEKINRASALLNQAGVTATPGNRHAVISAVALEGALNDTKIGSQDFNIIKALYEGSMQQYSGFKFHVMSDRDEGGLPKAGDNRSCYFFDMNSVGYAEALMEGMNGGVRKDWSPDYQGWLMCAKLSAGAIVIEAEGLIEVLVDETQAAV